jgi:hypothetical protein
MESEVTTAIIGVLGVFIGGLFGFLRAHLSDLPRPAGTHPGLVIPLPLPESEGTLT